MPGLIRVSSHNKITCKQIFFIPRWWVSSWDDISSRLHVNSLLKWTLKYVRKIRLTHVPIEITILLDITIQALHFPISIPLVFWSNSSLKMLDLPEFLTRLLFLLLLNFGFHVFTDVRFKSYCGYILKHLLMVENMSLRRHCLFFRIDDQIWKCLYLSYQISIM